MKLTKQTMQNVPFEQKTVLVRADYNVPLTVQGKINDDLRIRASIPTLQYLIDQHCKVIVMSHLGRPDGQPNGTYSLEVVANHLSELLGQPVTFVSDCIGDKVVQAVKNAAPGQVVLLENLRFHPEEEKNDEAFARQIARDTKARYFIQDGFGVVHRAHASTSAITQFIPSVAGLLLQHEVETIATAMKTPKRPFVAVMGGAKVSDKITVIETFLQKADRLLVGGAMANTFLAYKDVDMGKSKVESDRMDILEGIYAAAEQKVGAEAVDEFIELPSDVAVAEDIDASERQVVPIGNIKPEQKAFDIGDETIERFCEIVSTARTVIWNGTLGLAEKKAFAHGSARMALELATHPDVTSIIGGGDTADFVLKWDAEDGKSFTHVSTGGGASLELMAGKKLPGIEALLDRKK